MPRCTSTNKFAGYDEPELTLEDESLEEAHYEATVHVVRPCAECGEEMAENTFNLSAGVECSNCGTECGGHYGTERELPARALPSDPLPVDHEDYELKPVEFEIETPGEEPEIEESGGGRYKKNVFTCSITTSIVCGCCGESFEITAEDKCPASGFEVLV